MSFALFDYVLKERDRFSRFSCGVLRVLRHHFEAEFQLNLAAVRFCVGLQLEGERALSYVVKVEQVESLGLSFRVSMKLRPRRELRLLCMALDLRRRRDRLN